MSKKKVSLPPVQLLTLSGLANEPTPERLSHAGVPVRVTIQDGRRVMAQIVGPKASRPIGDDGVFRLTDAPLDRLAARRRLDEKDSARNATLYEAGQQLRKHHYMGGLVGIAANDLNRSGAGKRQAAIPISAMMAEHRDELRAVQEELHPDDWRATFAIVCEERTLEDVGRAEGFGHASAAAAVALDRLRRGLATAAELWGQLPPRPAAAARAA